MTTDAQTRDAQTGDTGDARLLLWIFWGGILFAVFGETALFLLADVGSLSTSTVETSGPSTTQLASVTTLSALMTLASVFIFVRRIGGGGMTTALLCWMLAKSVAISGLVMFTLAGSHWYFLPYAALFLMLMLAMHPRNFS